MDVPILLPDFDLDGPVRVCQWLAARGATVIEGDRLLEVVCGEVMVEVSAPVTGQLVRHQVGESDLVQAGDELGWIQPE